MKRLYVVLKNDDSYTSVAWITFDLGDAERVAEGDYGDCRHVSYEVEDVDSASVSKEIFDLLTKMEKEEHE